MAINAETAQWFKLLDVVEDAMESVLGRAVHSRAAVASAPDPVPEISLHNSAIVTALNRQERLPLAVLTAVACPAESPIGSLSLTVDANLLGFPGLRAQVEVMSCWSQMRIRDLAGDVIWDCEFSGPQVFLAADQHCNDRVRLAACFLAGIYRSQVWSAIHARAIACRQP